VKRFFSRQVSGNVALLSEQESHHALHVMRVGKGEMVEVADGQGRLWRGILSQQGKKTAVVTTMELQEQQEEHPQMLTLAVALTKNADRFEWLVEKATELGVRAIIPLITFRTERSRVNTGRLEQIVISAMKQSGHLYLPEIHPLTKTDHLWEIAASQHFLAHCNEDADKKMLNLACTPGLPVVVAIGPEGDFSLEEVNDARSSGWQPVSLGNSRLRVETAAVYTTAIVKMINEQ
jgi:16S rRNA (uracil1498-N3)-methyltransferase